MRECIPAYSVLSLQVSSLTSKNSLTCGFSGSSSWGTPKTIGVVAKSICLELQLPVHDDSDSAVTCDSAGSSLTTPQARPFRHVWIPVNRLSNLFKNSPRACSDITLSASSPRVYSPLLLRFFQDKPIPLRGKLCHIMPAYSCALFSSFSPQLI